LAASSKLGKRHCRKGEINQYRHKLLVGETTGGGFETLGGDKTQGFITKTKAYN